MMHPCFACKRETDKTMARVPVQDCLAYCADCKKRINSTSYTHHYNGRTQCSDCKGKMMEREKEGNDARS